MPNQSKTKTTPSEAKDKPRGLGLLLSEQYSHAEIGACRWRGVDAVLVDALRKDLLTIGHRLEFCPVVVRHHERWTPGDDHGESVRCQDVYRFTESDIRRLSNCTSDKPKRAHRKRHRQHKIRAQNDGAETQEEPQWRGEFQFLGSNHWYTISAYSQEGAEHTGNESLDSQILNHYFSTACLFIPDPRPNTNTDRMPSNATAKTSTAETPASETSAPSGAIAQDAAGLTAAKPATRASARRKKARL